ncbi:MAG: TolC family outer membrane protein [Alphaproteobacteria bacterium]|nr:TolC family outer membrane protein [Alphaproteobacteria bacterium]
MARIRIPAVVLACALLAASTSARAEIQTLEQAMAAAYVRNPSLQAQRAKLRAVDEKVAEAMSGWRPRIDAVAGVGSSRQRLQNGAVSPNTQTLSPRDVGITITQPVFNGFQTVASVRAADAEVQAQQGVLLNAEQTLLLDTARAYLDVVQAQNVRELMIANEDVLRKELDGAQNRFKVGEVTKTDISQAQARLNAAQASRIQADGDLASRRASYARLVGEVPQEVVQPQLTLIDPQTLDDAIVRAVKNHPGVLSAQHAKDAAKENVTMVQGRLLPEVSLVGSATRGWDQSLTLPERQDSSTLMARVTVPLYRAGADYARSRAANETVVQRGLELDDQRSKIHENVITAWQALTTARATIVANKAGVDAAKLAHYGVQEESKVGTRTVLDVLNAQQELLNAKVNLVRAMHDEALAILQVKASIGDLTASSLKLPVDLYRPQDHLNEVRGKWVGIGG